MYKINYSTQALVDQSIFQFHAQVVYAIDSSGLLLGALRSPMSNSGLLSWMKPNKVQGLGFVVLDEAKKVKNWRTVPYTTK